MFTDYLEIGQRAAEGIGATDAEALAVLRSGDAELLQVVAAASLPRQKFFSNQVKINYLVNIKSGLCPEDCGYCSQRLGSDTDVLKYPWLPTEEAQRQANFGLSGGASRVCLVASGRGPSNRDVKKVADMVTSIKDQSPEVEVCACLGFLKDGQAETLRDAGVDAYNHNLNTAETNYENICSSHTFADRVDTVNRARSAGLSPCSGLIVGMGETDEQVIEAVRDLARLDADSIPVNFLIPFEDTPMAGTYELTPQKAMRILCTVRLMCPKAELRIAGGRELHLRTLQPLALHVANSLFLGDYLTVEGQSAREDLKMIADGGFRILGTELSPQELLEKVIAEQDAHTAAFGATAESAPSLPCGKTQPVGASVQDNSTVSFPEIRRRGAGTKVVPNA